MEGGFFSVPDSCAAGRDAHEQRLDVFASDPDMSRTEAIGRQLAFGDASANSSFRDSILLGNLGGTKMCLLT